MLSKVVLSLTREFTVNLKSITGICLVSVFLSALRPKAVTNGEMLKSAEVDLFPQLCHPL